MTIRPGDRPTQRRRLLDAWGYEGEGLTPSPALSSWLRSRIGDGTPLPRLDTDRLDTLRADIPPPRSLPHLGVPHETDPIRRLANARGQGLPDLLRLRFGTLPALPDAVIRPDLGTDLQPLLRACSKSRVRVIPRGGGTSVTGGVNVLPHEEPTVVLDLRSLTGLEALDETSGLATFGGGTTGPEIEAALAERGLTLGHFPQSWELSTLGGWIATRASGQESLGYGAIADLVAGLEAVAPEGRLDLPPMPATAAGPDLRHLILGSEGRLGIVTRATVRVRPRPDETLVEGLLLPSWSAGLDAARLLLRQRVPLSLLRLSDEPETEVLLAIGLAGHRRLEPLVRGWLKLRGIPRGCLLLVGSAAGRPANRRSLDRARELLRPFGAVGLGERPGRRWLADRFRHPYLRDALLDRGIATETLETAAPWSRMPAITRSIRAVLGAALEPENERVEVLCHVSHPYPDGASLYFTFFYRCPTDPEEGVQRWALLKRAATEALTSAGGTLSHHHGVGSWHAPWLGNEIGTTGLELLRATAEVLDPAGVLNPTALLDPTDRLES